MENVDRDNESNFFNKLDFNLEELWCLLYDLKKVQVNSDSYVERRKEFDLIAETYNIGSTSQTLQLYIIDETSKLEQTKRHLFKLRKIERLLKDLHMNDDLPALQIEKLFMNTVHLYLSIIKNQESNIIVSRVDDVLNNITEQVLVGGYLPSLVIRKIFDIVNDQNYWRLRKECLNFILRINEKCSNQDCCLYYILENMSIDYVYLAESAEVLQILLGMVDINFLQRGVKQIVEQCCQLIAECDPKKYWTKKALTRCLAAFAEGNEDIILPEMALQCIRVSIGPYRSDIADLLFDLCKDRNICDLVNLIKPLILMLDDRDPDVVIRSYQILTQILSPPVAYFHRYHFTDDFWIDMQTIGIENQVSFSSRTMEVIKDAFQQIILSILICYIRHAIYPKTLEALLVFNCTLVIEVKDYNLLSRITSFLLNLQEAALSILPLNSLRHSFLQWAVTHLFLLVSDVYSISSLKDYVYEVIKQRKRFAPFLNSPISKANINLIPVQCLMEKQLVDTIINNWNNLVEPTRLLHENVPTLNLNCLPAWREFESNL